MKRWVCACGLLLLACSRNEHACSSAQFVECVERNLAWCEALGEFASTRDAAAPDGGLMCIPEGYPRPLIVPADAAIDSECPSLENMKNWLHNGAFTNGEGILTNGECCYSGIMLCS